MATTTPQAPAATKVEFTIEQLLATNIENAAKAKGQEVTVMVKNVTDWRPTTNGGLARKMVITDKGNFWVLASSVKNLPTFFTAPVPAKALLTQNGQYLNMSRLEFEGLATEKALMIREMPKGTALFALAS